MNAPTVRTVLWRDFLASALARVGIGVWGFVAVFELIGRLGGEQAARIHAFGAMNLLWIAMIASAIAVPLLAWRVTVIRNTFSHGQVLPATVVAIETQSNLRAIWVEYRHQGQTVRRRNAVRHSAAALPTIGAQVTVSISPANPQVAFIRELYVD